MRIAALTGIVFLQGFARLAGCPFFNLGHQFIYITIDELMAEIEKRATGEARKALQKYYASQGSYPHAAKLGATTNYSCDGSSLKGFLPTESKTTTGCSCTLSLIHI